MLTLYIIIFLLCLTTGLYIEYKENKYVTLEDLATESVIAALPVLNLIVFVGNIYQLRTGKSWNNIIIFDKRDDTK